MTLDLIWKNWSNFLWGVSGINYNSFGTGGISLKSSVGVSGIAQNFFGSEIKKNSPVHYYYYYYYYKTNIAKKKSSGSLFKLKLLIKNTVHVA